MPMPSCPKIIPMRAWVWVMAFTACWINYMLRNNISMIIIGMVKDPSKPESTGTYEWNEKMQGIILGAYYYLYPISSLMGGTASEKWGCRIVIATTTLASGILTLVSAVSATIHPAVLILNRTLIGFFGGFTFPALHCLIARWAPPAEKGKFVSSLMGGTLGTVFTWTLIGFLLKNFHWSVSFYVPGVITLVWCVMWYFVIYDSPSEHPRISEQEKEYITSALVNVGGKSKGLPPYKKIFMSIAYIAMVILHFGNIWGLFFVQTNGPKFVKEVLNYKIEKTGIVSSLPHLARLFGSIFFGLVGDCIISRKLLTTVKIRKSFTIFSHILPGLCLFLLPNFGNSAMIPISLITLSMAFNGAAVLTNLVNHQDLAPNYAGTLYGIANFFGAMSGFISPWLTGLIIEGKKEQMSAWRPVFYIGGSVYIFCAVVFVVLGSANVQPWNERTE